VQMWVNFGEAPGAGSQALLGAGRRRVISKVRSRTAPLLERLGVDAARSHPTTRPWPATDPRSRSDTSRRWSTLPWSPPLEGQPARSGIQPKDGLLRGSTTSSTAATMGLKRAPAHRIRYNSRLNGHDPDRHPVRHGRRGQAHGGDRSHRPLAGDRLRAGDGPPAEECEAMRQRLLAALARHEGIPFEVVREKLGI
jgi:hypothetical protein